MKTNLIKEAEKTLNEAGITNLDYIMSLQGPTIIFTTGGGRQKFEKNDILKNTIADLGVLTL